MRTLLTNKQKISQYKQISKGVTDDVINSFIRTAQDTDVAPLLGERLYNIICTTPSDHAALLNGGSYTVDGETYYHEGLAAVIAHFAHSRYVYFGRNTDTPFGHVQKINPQHSTPTPETTSKSMFIESRKEAAAYWEQVYAFMIRTDYAQFCNCDVNPDFTNAGNVSIKVTKIGK